MEGIEFNPDDKEFSSVYSVAPKIRESLFVRTIIGLRLAKNHTQANYVMLVFTVAFILFTVMVVSGFGTSKSSNVIINPEDIPPGVYDSLSNEDRERLGL